MRRFSLWLRGQPFVADCLLATGLVLLDLLALASYDHSIDLSVFALATVALTVPIAWRRVHPRIVAAAVGSASVFTTVVSAGVGENASVHPAVLGLPIMLYTLVAYDGRIAAGVFAGFLAVDSLVNRWMTNQDLLVMLLLSVLMYALAWVAAEFLGARRAYDEAVEARLVVADYDRDRRAEEAVAMERMRIARELHDVIAHGVSVMVVQADGASYAIRRNPERAEQAVANIAATGRAALAELRRTVGLLRTAQNADDMPQYGTAGLAKVVDMMSRAGLNVELEQTGNLDDIAPAISLGIHRVVQESLTNVLRHAGHAPKARVAVVRRADDVLVEIVDNGSEPDTKAVQGTGNGVLGMRERVAVLRGTLEVGRTAEGEWRVRAELPLEER